jgi:choline dehydrogenase-like flavoprotein
MSSPVANAIPTDPEADIWDVVVIGAGAGGGTTGFDLARRGRSVLFLERGRLLSRDPDIVRGPPQVVERKPGDFAATLRHGWWPSPIYQVTRGGELERPAPFGCGTGGTTAVFSMVMDRLAPEDFTPGRFFSDMNATVVDEWPISYGELEPFYQHAETLYRVRGTRDPIGAPAGSLLVPAPPSKMEVVLSGELEESGLNPYRIHYACEHVEDCTGCFASLCPGVCRNDAGRICVEPALTQHSAQILPNCQVRRLDVSARSVRRAICDWNGSEVAIRGRVFVLAANALFTPALLLCSANEEFPDGLANSSGLVGRNLMFHASDYMLARLKDPPPRLDGRMTHGLSINDFYMHDNTKLGNIHAHSTYGPSGAPVPPATWFATVVEDLPHVGNRVYARGASADRVSWEYTPPAELYERCSRLIRCFTEATRGHLDVAPHGSVGNANMSHACGTCRFGNDPASSVLDRDNRAHDLDNLYVVDASFFPSSGAIQPSLTIAANGLRVGEAIDRRL